MSSSVISLFVKRARYEFKNIRYCVKRFETSWGLPLAKATPKHPEKEVVYHTEELKFIYNSADIKKTHIYDALNSRLLLFVIVTPFLFYWPFMCIRWVWKDPVEYGQ